MAPAFNYRGISATTSRGPVAAKGLPSQQALQIDAFALCVRDNLQTIVPGEMGRRDMVMVEAIYASAAAGGKRVEVKV